MDGGKGTHRGEVSIFIQLQVFTLKDLVIPQRVRVMTSGQRTTKRVVAMELCHRPLLTASPKGSTCWKFVVGVCKKQC